MLEVTNASMVDLLESKLDLVLKAIETLSIRTNHIEDFVTRFHNDHKVETSQFILSITPKFFHPKNQQCFGSKKRVHLLNILILQSSKNQSLVFRRSLMVLIQSFKDSSIKFNLLRFFNLNIIQQTNHSWA